MTGRIYTSELVDGALQLREIPTPTLDAFRKAQDSTPQEMLGMCPQWALCPSCERTGFHAEEPKR